ncbi:MAG: shikimate kinase, partial [Gammaproteobacteria bacterium]|nr:shikimate kinase [Gammaproteobacteria bacterium]
HDIQERTGVDIPFIFEKEGEEGFRRRETRSLLALLDKPGCVIATGGGAILANENRQAMKEHALVVFLAASVETQLRRTKRGRHRPLLDQPDPEAILRELYARRLPLYRDAADLEIDTDGQHVEEVAKRLLQRLREEHEVLFDA